MDAMTVVDKLPTGSKTDFALEAWIDKCYQAMNDDFNTPILIAHLFDAVKQINVIKEGKASITEADRNLLSKTLKAFVHDVLGILGSQVENDGSEKLQGVMEMVIAMRNEARANKDFATSDKIRDELIALGIQLKDGKDGTTFSLDWNI